MGTPEGFVKGNFCFKGVGRFRNLIFDLCEVALLLNWNIFNRSDWIHFRFFFREVGCGCWNRFGKVGIKGLRLSALFILCCSRWSRVFNSFFWALKRLSLKQRVLPPRWLENWFRAWSRDRFCQQKFSRWHFLYRKLTMGWLLICKFGETNFYSSWHSLMRDAHTQYQRLFARVLLANVRDLFFYFGVNRDQDIINVAVILVWVGNQSLSIISRKFSSFLWPEVHSRWFNFKLTWHLTNRSTITKAKRLVKDRWWVNIWYCYWLISIRLSDHPLSELCIFFLRLSTIFIL